MGLPKLVYRSDISISLSSISNSVPDTRRQSVKEYIIPGEAYTFETFIKVQWE